MNDDYFRVFNLFSRLSKLTERYGDNLNNFVVTANKIADIPILIIKDGDKVVECIVLQKSDCERGI